MTIESIVSQLDDNDEFIIIDGGSTDGTMSILENYRHRFSHLVSEPDNGISDAFNKGLDLCSGEVVGIVNSDDWITPDAISLIKSYAVNKEVSIIYSDVNFWSSSKLSFVKNSNHKVLGGLLRGCSIYHPTVFVKSHVYKKIGGYNQDYKLRMDFDFFMRARKNNFVFFKSPHVLSNYRKGGVSSRSLNAALHEEYLIIKNTGEYSFLYLKAFWMIRYLVLFIVKPIREKLLSRKVSS